MATSKVKKANEKDEKPFNESVSPDEKFVDSASTDKEENTEDKNANDLKKPKQARATAELSTLDDNSENADTESSKSDKSKAEKDDKAEKTEQDNKNSKETKAVNKNKKSDVKYQGKSKKKEAFAKANDVAADYYAVAKEDNVGAEAASDTFRSIAKKVRNSKTKTNKLKNQKKLAEKRLKNEYKLEYKLKKEELKQDEAYKKMSLRKKRQQRKQLKKRIKRKHAMTLSQRLKRRILGDLSLKDFVLNLIKKVLIKVAIIALPVILIFLFPLILLALVASFTTSTVVSTSYLAPPNLLEASDNYYKEKEQKLYADLQLENIKLAHPGFDEYKINRNGEVAHNTYDLLAYLTAMHGDFKKTGQEHVNNSMDLLFDRMYKVEYKTITETRFREEVVEVIDEATGEVRYEKQQVPYLHKTLVVNLQKTEIDILAKEDLGPFKEKYNHYESLVKYHGNAQNFMGNHEIIEQLGGIEKLHGENAYKNASDEEKKLFDAALVTPTAGPGYCAAWVSSVYRNAGRGYIGGNANDMYRNFANRTDIKNIKIGAVVAVESSSGGGEAGRRYGHVGIYIGDGMVMENIGQNVVGQVRKIHLEEWINKNCQDSPFGFGNP